MKKLQFEHFGESEPSTCGSTRGMGGGEGQATVGVRFFYPLQRALLLLFQSIVPFLLLGLSAEAQQTPLAELNVERACFGQSALSLDSGLAGASQARAQTCPRSAQVDELVLADESAGLAFTTSAGGVSVVVATEKAGFLGACPLITGQPSFGQIVWGAATQVGCFTFRGRCPANASLPDYSYLVCTFDDGPNTTVTSAFAAGACAACSLSTGSTGDPTTAVATSSTTTTAAPGPTTGAATSMTTTTSTGSLGGSTTTTGKSSAEGSSSAGLFTTMNFIYAGAGLAIVCLLLLAVTFFAFKKCKSDDDDLFWSDDEPSEAIPTLSMNQIQNERMGAVEGEELEGEFAPAVVPSLAADEEVPPPPPPDPW